MESYSFKIENLQREADGYVHTANYLYTGVSTTGKSHSVVGIVTFTRPESLVPYNDRNE